VEDENHLDVDDYPALVDDDLNYLRMVDLGDY
jgi:hypothetical protein